MKHKLYSLLFLLSFLLVLSVPSSSQVDLKVTELAEVTSPATTDLLYVVINPATTPLSRKATLSNVIKSFTFTIPYTARFPMAGCDSSTAASVWDLPTSSAASASCVTGSNIQKGVLTFTGGTSAQMSWTIPQSVTSTVDLRLVWQSSQTSSTGTWALSGVCTATDGTETDDPAFVSFWAPSADTSPSVASRPKTTSATSVSWPSGCAAGELLHLKLSWAAGSATSFQGIELLMTYYVSVTQ